MSSVYEVAPLQVDRVDVVVKYLGEGHARATHHFHQGTTDLQNLDFQNIRDRVRECLDGNRDEYYDLEVLLACPPGKYDPRDAFPMLIQQGFETLAMERLSECVNSHTHTHLASRGSDSLQTILGWSNASPSRPVRWRQPASKCTWT